MNTDNRLMSGVTLSEEFRRLSATLGLGLADVERLTINAMKSAFVGYDERVAIIYGRIKPGFAALRGEPSLAYALHPRPSEDEGRSVQASQRSLLRRG